MSYLNISSNLFLCFFNFIHIPNGYGGNIEHVMQLKWKFEYRKYIIMFKQKIEFLFSHSRLPSSLRQNNHMPTGPNTSTLHGNQHSTPADTNKQQNDKGVDAHQHQQCHSKRYYSNISSPTPNSHPASWKSLICTRSESMWNTSIRCVRLRHFSCWLWLCLPLWCHSILHSTCTMIGGHNTKSSTNSQLWSSSINSFSWPNTMIWTMHFWWKNV